MAESRIVVPKGWGEGEVIVYRQEKFQSGVRNKFWRWIAVVVA